MDCLAVKIIAKNAEIFEIQIIWVKLCSLVHSEQIKESSFFFKVRHVDLIRKIKLSFTVQIKTFNVVCNVCVVDIVQIFTWNYLPTNCHVAVVAL